MAELAYEYRVSIDGVRSRFLDNGNGLQMHTLDAGPERPDAPVVVLLHGFPELAFSWRQVIPRLANAGFRVIAPDQRGFGQTSGWDARFEADLSTFRFLNLVRDVMGLLAALEVETVEAVVGHDFGASIAGYAALLRPDRFKRLVLMSAPFTGAPVLSADSLRPPDGVEGVTEALRRLPRPRKHYHWYYTRSTANEQMVYCEQGVHDFLRAYFHHKSADWPNHPHELDGWTADALSEMPTYYIMDALETMPEAVAHHMPGEATIAQCDWLTEGELRVYSTEFQRTGFQGGLNWYRVRMHRPFNRELAVFAGMTIDIPSLFVSGAQDWGVYQTPGALHAMQNRLCTNMETVDLVAKAGHWVQQERGVEVADRLLDFLRKR
ncbi:MAG: alpha/beta hydrolase [Pseudomonadota bacterium]